MEFSIDKSLEILEHTPRVLKSMLQHLSLEWISVNEGPGTWSVYDVIGHLIHGEKTDWMPRALIILSDKADKSFEPFDRFAQMQQSGTASLPQLLEEFSQLRKMNIEKLKEQAIGESTLQEKGIHPAFAQVTLGQLLATWTVHDLNHVAQISRVIAKQYKEAVGPWTAYLKILQ